MKNLDLTMDAFMHRRWKLLILAFLLLVLAIFFTPADSVAQAVPPRSQTLQMIRPLVRPPEPPIEKEIRQNKEEAKKFEKKIEVQYLKKQELLPPVTQVPKLGPPTPTKRGNQGFSPLVPISKGLITGTRIPIDIPRGSGSTRSIR